MTAPMIAWTREARVSKRSGWAGGLGALGFEGPGLIALSMAIAIAGCGDAAAGDPARVAISYFAAVAARDGHRVCRLSTPQRRAEFVALIGFQDGRASSCPEAVARSELSLTPDLLAPLRHARVILRTRVGNSALVALRGTRVRLYMRRAGSSWLVASSSGGL